jgi:TPR repeat protein
MTRMRALDSLRSRGRAIVCAAALGGFAASVLLAGGPSPQACEAMLGGEYRDPPEWIDLGLDRGRWDLALRWRGDAFARKEFVVSSETLANWNDLVTWNVNFAPTRLELAKVQEDFLRTLSSSCTTLKVRQITTDPEDRAFEWSHDGCYGRPAQTEITRLIAGAIGMHTLSFSHKGGLSDADRDRWWAWMSALQVKQRIPMKGELSPFDQAQVAIWTGKYPRAVELLKPLADDGDPAAQELYARLHAEGWGVPRSYEQARVWFERAAEKNAAAQYNLGRLYDNGWGVPQDAAKAVALYRTAAERGDADASGRLGFMLATGLGTEKNPAEAYGWFEKAAAGGHGHAQYWLAKLTLEGARGEVDLPRARALLEEAAREGEPEAQYELGVLCARKTAGPCEDREAIRWLTRAAMQGNDEARKFYAEQFASAAK